MCYSNGALVLPKNHLVHSGGSAVAEVLYHLSMQRCPESSALVEEPMLL